MTGTFFINDKPLQAAKAQDLLLIGEKTDSGYPLRATTVSSILAASGIITPQVFGAVGDGVADDTAALQAALNTGKTVYVPAGRYKVTNQLRMTTPAQQLIGAGCAKWFIASRGLDNSLDYGTIFIFTGTPQTTETFWGVTDQSLSGGWVANPDTTDARDTHYKLSDFTNKDATPTTAATLKECKVAIVAEEAHGGAIKNILILKNYNGISGYNDETLTGLGDDWDIGLAVKNSSNFKIDNVATTGYWLMAGGLFYNVTNSERGEGEGEFNHVSNSFFQGYKGVAFRGADALRVVAKTSDSITVPWTSSNLLNGSGFVYYGKTRYDFTSTSVSGNQLILNGVTPNTASIAVGGEVSIQALPNFGTAGSKFDTCTIIDLAHKSRLKPNSADLGYDAPGTAIEASGAILRDIDFYNTTVYASEVICQTLDLEDLNFSGCYFEQMGSKNIIGGDFNTSGVRLIVQPRDDVNSYGLYPIKGVNKVVIDDMSEVHFSVDFAPLVRHPSLARFAGEGLFKPFTHELKASGILAGMRPIMPSGYNTISTFGMINGGMRWIDESFSTRMSLYGDDGLLRVEGLSFNNGITPFTYAEGTYNPDFAFLNAGYTITSSVGRWRRVGKLVFVDIELNVTGLDNTDASSVSITLPESAVAAGFVAGTLDVASSTLLNIFAPLALSTQNSVTVLTITNMDTQQRIKYTDCNTGGLLRISCHYMIA